MNRLFAAACILALTSAAPAYSAPPLAGKNVANPFAALLTVGLMLAHLGWPDEERRIEDAVAAALEAGHCTRDVGGALGTDAAAAGVLQRVAAR